MVFVFRQIQEKNREQKNGFYTFFVELTEAIRHSQLEGSMSNLQMPRLSSEILKLDSTTTVKPTRSGQIQQPVFHNISLPKMVQQSPWSRCT